MIKEHILLWELIGVLQRFGMLPKVLRFIKCLVIKRGLVHLLGEAI